MARVALICQLILRVLLPKKAPYHLLSVDEKTGIQAPERIKEETWMRPGKPTRIEQEYKRNGTTCLLAAMEVKNGKVAHYRIHPTRKEPDFFVFIQQTVAQYPKEDKINFLADQLNTHQSASLVEWIAEQEDIPEELGKKESQKSQSLFRRGFSPPPICLYAQTLFLAQSD